MISEEITGNLTTALWNYSASNEEIFSKISNSSRIKLISSKNDYNITLNEISENKQIIPKI